MGVTNVKAHPLVLRTSYFYPMVKIKKLARDLVPGVNPPSRLVTALQEGVSKRSDVF